jgi:hypothetical protein
MNIQTQKPVSKFRDMAPPGVKVEAPKPKEEVQDAVELKFRESGPDASEGMPMWKKIGAASMAAVSGMMAFAPKAHAAPIDALVTQEISESDGLEVVVLPRGTARVDLLRRQVKSVGSEGTEFRNAGHTDTGVHLGRGIFHDANGNLVLVPSIAAGWNDVVSLDDASRVEMEIPGSDDALTRFGEVVMHKKSSTNRQAYVDKGDVLEFHKKGGKQSQYEVLNNGVQYRGDHGELEWRVTETGNNVVNVDGPGAHDFTVTYADQGIDVVGRQDVHNEVVFGDSDIRVKGDGTDYKVHRSVTGAITEVKPSGIFNDKTIVKDGNTIRSEGTFGTSRIHIDPAEFTNNQEINFSKLKAAIEEAEPGYAEKHPLIMGVLEYATANPGLVGEGDASDSAFLGAGKALSTGSGAIASGQAISQGARALSLAENARALGASALQAQAAAQAAAAANNMTQAAALGAEASNLAGQAKALGGEAMKLGEGAQNAVQVARLMNGLAGTLAVIDGGMDLHEGASDKSTVDGAIIIANAMFDQLQQEQTGAELERTTEDYSKVMTILQQLRDSAQKQQTVGGLKILGGGLLIISALASGGVVPLVIGAAGALVTAGTSAYEHWDHLKAIFTGEEVEVDPTLKDVLPDPLQDEIIFDLNQEITPSGTTKGVSEIKNR